MKKLSILTIIIFVAALAMVGCGKTELAFKNSPDSTGAINSIVWADGDAEWYQTDGWNNGETTGSKEVSETSGTVACTVFDSGDFAPADVIFPSSGSDSSLSLNEGESNTYTLVASPAAP